MIMLSVVIPTCNRADLLQSSLQSLQSQTLSVGSFEVLVIDNGSTDNTRQVVEAFQQQLRNVRYFYDPTPGLHVGRHLGMKMAKSDILVYADDDIEAFPSWLAAIAESFHDQDVALVGGKNLPKFECGPPDWIMKMWRINKDGNRVLSYLSILDLGDEIKQIHPYYVFGCNFSIRKKTLLNSGGFHPDAMPQELIKYRGDGETHVSAFINMKRLKTIYHPGASVFHMVPQNRLTEEYFCKRAYLQGISDSYTQIRDKDMAHHSTIMRTFEYLRLLQKKIGLYASPRKRHIESHYYQGFMMHQNLSAEDKNLYEWIIRPNYF
jgi:glycosyltransferase involved in cell wall biosynthesis